MSENVSNGEASEGAEIARLSPREIHDKSVHTARTLVETLTPDEMRDGAYATSQALGYMASVDAKAGDIPAVRHWAEKIRNLGKHGEAELTRVYYLGTTIGDETAFYELGNLLREEKERQTAERERTKFSEERYSYMDAGDILNIVEMCASRGTSADTWINDFKIDSKHVDFLKLRYYFKAKGEGGDGDAIGSEYLKEVTQHFLTGSDIDSESVTDNALHLWLQNDDIEIKRRIFQKVKEKSEDPPADLGAFREFLWFAGAAVDNGEVLGEEDIHWLEDKVKNYRQLVFNNDSDPTNVPTNVNRYYALFQLKLALRRGAPPVEVIREIDSITAELLNTDIPDSASAPNSDDILTGELFANRQFISDFRDTQLLVTAAEEYAHKGDFESANTCLVQIASPKFRESGLVACLEAAKTSEEIEILRPDDMTIMFDETLGDTFKVREAILKNDLKTVEDMAKGLAGNPEYDTKDGHKKFLFEGLIDYCVTAAYKHSQSSGRKLVEELTKILKENSLSSNKNIQHLISLQLKLKDPAGLNELYKLSQAAEKPVDRFRESANVARQSDYFLAA